MTALKQPLLSISLIDFNELIKDVNKYIENAISKKERRNEFELVKSLQ